MPISHALIMGAGPAGLAAALSIAKLPPSGSTPPIRVTVLELRPDVATLGGAINLTPLAMRYLDRLGAGSRLRPRGAPVAAGIDMVSLRTGALRGTLWKGVDALRVRRHDLAMSLLEEVRVPENSARIDLRYGVKVVGIQEEGDPSADGAVVLSLENGEEIRGDILIGCDGLHSVARTKYVDPERKEVYSGKASAYGYAKVDEPGNAGITRSDGQPCVIDSTIVGGRYGSLLATFFTQEKKDVYLAAVMNMKNEYEGDTARDGWKAKGEDKVKVREDISGRFRSGKLPGLAELVESVDDWTMFPVYQLPPDGRWSKGRVILIGDAAHAVSSESALRLKFFIRHMLTLSVQMPPQGESTGVAIEDGVLLARVLQRHMAREIPQLFDDYEKVRRKPIDKLYKESVWRWNSSSKDDAGWLGGIVSDWMLSAVLSFMDFNKSDYFVNDVEQLQLPS